MARDVISLKVDEDMIFLFIPPPQEEQADFIDDIIDDLSVLADTELKLKLKYIKEN